LEVTEAWKTLGFKTAPTGDSTAQFEHMLEASHKWAAHIKASNLRQMDAWLSLHVSIVACMRMVITWKGPPWLTGLDNISVINKSITHEM
jgi:hypothetical protein